MLSSATLCFYKVPCYVMSVTISITHVLCEYTVLLLIPHYTCLLWVYTSVTGQATHSSCIVHWVTFTLNIWERVMYGYSQGSYVYTSIGDFSHDIQGRSRGYTWWLHRLTNSDNIQNSVGWGHSMTILQSNKMLVGLWRLVGIIYRQV